MNFCTLTQRFGRAARDPTVQGIGLLLVEKACFDADKVDKGQQKRKGNQLKGNTRKRARGDLQQQQEAEIQTQSPEVDDDDSDDGGEEEESQNDEHSSGAIAAENSQPEAINLEDLWVEYVSWARENSQDTPKGKKTSPALEPAMRDLIGTRQPTVHCLRVPSKVYFANSKALGKVPFP